MSSSNIASTNISLKVPFSEKDQAKSLGARWNAEAKHWYVPQGADSTPFEKWFTSEQPQSTTLSPAKTASQSNTITNISHSTSNQVLDDDLDAINAKLRDAFESRDSDLY